MDLNSAWRVTIITCPDRDTSRRMPDDIMLEIFGLSAGRLACGLFVEGLPISGGSQPCR